MMSVFFGTTVFVNVNTDSIQLGFFILSMVMVFILNCKHLKKKKNFN